jgi:hypothetical protein
MAESHPADLHHTQQHRAKCENTARDQNKTDRHDRSMPTITDPGDRFVFLTPEITDGPSILPERNNQGDSAGPDESQSENPLPRLSELI